MIRWLVVTGVVLALDQMTKLYVISTLAYREQIQVLPFFSWVRWHNDGAAFSFLSSAGGWQRWFFVVLAICFSGYLLYEMKRLKPGERALGWVFALILGGALGNLVDRLYLGYVVDFIYFSYAGYSFPAFNIADSALFCGAALWILLMILERRQSRLEGGDATDHR